MTFDNQTKKLKYIAGMKELLQLFLIAYLDMPFDKLILNSVC